MGETALLELIDPCLNLLKALKGSFDRNTDILPSVGQYPQEDGSEKLTARVPMIISVGMQRALHLQQVFEAYHALPSYELPNCFVKAHSEILKFQ